LELLGTHSITVSSGEISNGKNSVSINLSVYDSGIKCTSLCLCHINGCSWHPCLTPVILATQQAEIRKIMVQRQSGQYFARPYLKKKTSLSRAGGGVGIEFKVQYCGKIAMWQIPLFILGLDTVLKVSQSLQTEPTT
jgi:hypothetical protein